MNLGTTWDSPRSQNVHARPITSDVERKKKHMMKFAVQFIAVAIPAPNPRIFEGYNSAFTAHGTGFRPGLKAARYMTKPTTNNVFHGVVEERRLSSSFSDKAWNQKFTP